MGRKTRQSLGGLLAAMLLAYAPVSQSAVIDFGGLVAGAASFGYDSNGDTINDVIFSTTSGFGFNRLGPGPNMTYITEPGLEGTTSLPIDVRVDFRTGATGSLGFGFAMSASVGGPPTAVTFAVFGATDNLLGTTTVNANFTDPPGASPRSSYPEALVNLGFSGTASYATLSFTSTVAQRFIVDNFNGTFGPVVGRVAEPAALALIGLVLAGVGAGTRRRRAR